MEHMEGGTNMLISTYIEHASTRTHHISISPAAPDEHADKARNVLLDMFNAYEDGMLLDWICMNASSVNTVSYPCGYLITRGQDGEIVGLDAYIDAPNAYGIQNARVELDESGITLRLRTEQRYYYFMVFDEYARELAWHTINEYMDA
jgi:hypothetical protein